MGSPEERLRLGRACRRDRLLLRRAGVGIPQGESLGNHVAYLKSWLEALRNDRNFIFKAAKQASKVTDYLLGFVKKPQPEAAGAAA